MVKNSNLRRQFFILLLRKLFRYNEEHFIIMNKTYYKNCCIRGSQPEVFCKWCVQLKIRNFYKKHLCRSLIFNKVICFYFHILILIGKHLRWSSLSLKLETVILQLKNSIEFFSSEFSYRIMRFYQYSESN